MDHAPLMLDPAIVLGLTDDGYLAFDTRSERLHHLNATAALLVELCDGHRDRAALLAMLQPLLADATALGAVTTWVDGAVRDGLLRETTALDSTGSFLPPAPTAAALQRQAEDLRGRGRVLASYLCQRRAAELRPDAPNGWYLLGELAHIVGRRDEARTAYERYAALKPDDAEIGHILLALQDSQPPPRASDDCIRQLYARFARNYDESMLDDLDYRAPDHLQRAIRHALGEAAPGSLDILDLGCGTGLSGRPLRALARRLVGVDLAPEMIARARRRGLYDRLDVAEITAWLAASDASPEDAPAGVERFDLITACDCLIYFGDLRQVLGPASERLKTGGVVVLTVESGQVFPFKLTDSGRYAHHRDHLVEVADAAGLTVALLDEVVLRYEYGEPVVGLVAAFRKPASHATAARH